MGRRGAAALAKVLSRARSPAALPRAAGLARFAFAAMKVSLSYFRPRGSEGLDCVAWGLLEVRTIGNNNATSIDFARLSSLGSEWSKMLLIDGF